MKRGLPALLAVAAEGVFAVLTVMLLPLIPLTVSWVFADKFYGPFSARLDAAYAIWGLSLGGPVQVQGGVVTEQAFTVAMAPLGLTLVTVMLGARLGRRLLTPARPALLLLAGVCYLAAAVIALAFARWELWQLESWRPVLFGVLLYLVTAAVTSEILNGRAASAAASVAAAPLDHLSADLRRRWQQLPHWLSETIRLSLRCCWTLFWLQILLAALTLMVLQILHAFEMVQLYNSLHVGLMGLMLLLLVQLALLPNLLIWMVSWQFGVGFDIGGTHFGGLAEAGQGAVPLLPVFGALPVSNLPGALNVIAAVAFAAPVGVWLMKSRRVTFSFGWRLIILLIASFLLALMFAILGAFAGGAIGPGLLRQAGPNPLLLFLVVLVESAAGMMAGVLIGMLLRPHMPAEKLASPQLGTELRRLFAAAPPEETRGVGRLLDKPPVGGSAAAEVTKPFAKPSKAPRGLARQLERARAYLNPDEPDVSAAKSSDVSAARSSGASAAGSDAAGDKAAAAGVEPDESGAGRKKPKRRAPKPSDKDPDSPSGLGVPRWPDKK